MEIITATEQHLPIIRQIAYDTWPETFGSLMSKQQLDFMLDWMYSLESLQKQLANNHIFLLAHEDNHYYGYASYELNYEASRKTKIHKLYILPTSQGRGLGKMFLQKVQDAALAVHNNTLLLNVKRDNKAVEFYKTCGFEITDTVDIEIEHGFQLMDYVMEKKINA